MCHFSPHSQGRCANQWHLITLYPFVSVQAGFIALFDFLSTRLVCSDPHKKCVNATLYSLSVVSLYVMCAGGGWKHCAEGEGCSLPPEET